jgi:hypothetical protein
MPPKSPQPSTSRQTTMTPEPDASPSTNTLTGSRSSPVIKNVTPSCSKRVRLIKDATPQAGLSGLKKNCAKSVRTPEEVRPLRKAGPRQATKKGRKKRTTAILTDTPIKKKGARGKSATEKRKSCRGWAHEQCTDGSEMYYWAV